jgi:Domain of unknown function (DUF4349)
MSMALERVLLAAALVAGGCGTMAYKTRRTPANDSEQSILQGGKGLESEEAGEPESPARMVPAALFAPDAHAGAQGHIKEPVPGEKLMITGAVTAITDDVAGLMAAVRVHAMEVGGTIADEELSGDAQHRSASITLRLPPTAMTAFIDWLGQRSTLDGRRLTATDVTREYFDRDLAIRNLELTMSRLHDLAKRPNAELKDVIAVENEMTRVRGELEKLHGEQRLLGDRVARATLTVQLSMIHGVHAEPELKFELVPHLALLHLVDAGSRATNRAGLGVSVMFSRWFSLDFEMLPRKDADARSYLLTITTATYSDFLGGGRRRFFNPYLGLRAGGAKLNGFTAFAYGADVGLEIVRFKLFLVEISGRALGLWYHRDNPPTSDIVLEGLLGVGVPF